MNGRSHYKQSVNELRAVTRSILHDMFIAICREKGVNVYKIGLTVTPIIMLRTGACEFFCDRKKIHRRYNKSSDIGFAIQMYISLNFAAIRENDTSA